MSTKPSYRFRIVKTDPIYFGLAFPVKYSAERPVINVVNKNSKILLEQTLLTKADFWEYEQEWRLIDQEDGAGLYPFPTQSLDGIILGADISAEHRKLVLSWVSSSRTKIEIIQASLNKDLYRLDFAQV